MNVLANPCSNDDEILRYCTKKCGYIVSTEDRQFFALGCLFCPNIKFLYFDAYIGHVQSEHSSLERNDNGYNSANHQMCYGGIENGYGNNNKNDDLGDTDAALLVPQMVMVKQEIPDEEAVQSTPAGYLNSGAMGSDVCSQNNAYIKEEQGDTATPMDADIPPENYSGNGCVDEDEDQMVSDDDYDDDNYDDLVEESLVNNSGGDLAQHIKDKKMISFIIDSYRRNPYLWDDRNPNFRDRKRRQQFLDWMLAEFKRRFNVSLARNAITKKWANLRTIYKRECKRMSLEQTNVSTLWCYKELQFLHRLYGADKMEEQPAVKLFCGEMNTENSGHLTKGQMKKCAPQECQHCKKMEKNLQTFQEKVTKQNETIIGILADYKVLLERLSSQNTAITEISNIFPINCEEKLAECNEIFATQSIAYTNYMKSLLKGNVERNLNEILGAEIIMGFNVEGTCGKKRLRIYENVYAALIDAIYSFSTEPDKTLKAAFQRQKKRIFKQTSRSKQKNDENMQSGPGGSSIISQEC